MNDLDDIFQPDAPGARDRFGVREVVEAQVPRSSGADVDRAFIKGFAQVGIEARYRPLPALSVDASFMGFPAAGTMPVVLDAGARIGWMPFTDGGPASALELILGVTYQRIDFEDAQPTPNHTRIELGPAALVGAELAW